LLLLLAAVQEDFALLRLPDEPGPNPQEAKHMMTAASVCFSFHGLAEKLGTTTLAIHAPVPGFEEQLEKLLNRTFTALQVTRGMTVMRVIMSLF
jgi:hypothetical protein